MSKKAKKKKNKFLKFCLGMFITFSVLLAISLIVLYVTGIAPTVMDLYKDSVEKVNSSTIDTFKADQTSTVYDTNGDVIAEIQGDKSVYYLESENIPTYVKNAFICIEDKKFYSHNGIDLKAILRSATSIIKNSSITQGGSTITQQLSRNVFLTHTVSWERKVEEIFIALQLEKIYTKAQILEFYINNIYFSNGYYGIQAASQGYFSTDVHNLSLSQIAFLCAIPNNPTLYDPLTNLDNTLKRRDRILGQMYEDGKISETEYNQALAEEIVLNVQETQTAENNYAETYIYYCATKALMELQGFKFQYYFDTTAEQEAYEESYSALYSECKSSLYTSGYKIYTTIDLNMQEQLQTAIDDNLYGYVSTNDDGVYNMQASGTCIDNSTGSVVAIVGGRSQDGVTGYTLNRAYQSFRQPGSSIKPLIVYTPALENGYTPDTVVVDEPIADGPTNYGGGYAGSVTIRYAVQKSINTIAWKLLEELTPTVGLQYLKNMNFAKIDSSDYVSAAALGGFTNGVSSLEMASAYATIENDGMYREPTCIKKIVNAEGETIYQNESEETEIYKENASRMMTSMLQSVMTSGTGSALQISGIPTAGKTGTTNDYKDGWFCGFSAYYTTSIWVGCDMPQSIDGLTGSSYPGRIWKQFMTNIHEGLEAVEFPSYVNYSSVQKYPTVTDTTEEIIEDTTEAASEEETETIEQEPEEAVEEIEEIEDIPEEEE